MAAVNPDRASRRDRARATRLRVIHAAQKVFTSHGYAGARMTDIAADAGVAVQTVYFTFHTKAELLQACYELAVLGEDDPTPPRSGRTTSSCAATATPTSPATSPTGSGCPRA